MGRRERELDPLAGPVENFAAALRELRANAGLPTYREMASRTHYSASVLSRAAGGGQLPSLAVVRAYAEACGAEPEPYERRWARARAALNGGGAVGGALEGGGGTAVDPLHRGGGTAGDTMHGGGGTAPDAAPDGAAHPAGTPAPREALARPARPAWYSVRSVRLGAGLLVLLACGIGAWTLYTGQSLPPASPATGWQAVNQHITDQHETSGTVEDMDGDDPRARGCGADATILRSVPLNLPGGHRFGTLRLRGSRRCATAWASAYYSNPKLYTVWLAAHRTSDGAEVHSQWDNNTPPGSYGDMLSTANGCVWVEAKVETPEGTGPVARTPCLR